MVFFVAAVIEPQMKCLKYIFMYFVRLNANPQNWSNTLKQFVAYGVVCLRHEHFHRNFSGVLSTPQ